MGPFRQAPSKTLTPQVPLNPWVQQVARCFLLEKGGPPHLEIIERPLRREETGEMSSVLPKTCPHSPPLLLNKQIGPSMSMACVEEHCPAYGGSDLFSQRAKEPGRDWTGTRGHRSELCWSGGRENRSWIRRIVLTWGF